MFYVINTKDMLKKHRKDLEVTSSIKPRAGHIVCKIVDVAVLYDMGHSMYMGGVDLSALSQIIGEITELAVC